MPMLGLDWLRVIDMTTVDMATWGFFVLFMIAALRLKGNRIREPS